ncbi:purine permease [Streptomyces tanashiensis]
MVFNHLGRGRDADEVTAPMEPGEEISGSASAKAAHVH